MAIQQVTTANTFQQWLVATQNLIAVANNLTDGPVINSAAVINVTGSGNTLNIANNIVVTGRGYISTANINGASITTLNASSVNAVTMNVTSDVLISGNLVVSGNVTLDAIGFDDLIVSGSGSFANNISVVGNTSDRKSTRLNSSH